MILDTNGLSAVADGHSALEPILRKAAQIAIPLIVLGEYRYGISTVPRPEALRIMADRVTITSTSLFGRLRNSWGMESRRG